MSPFTPAPTLPPPALQLKVCGMRDPENIAAVLALQPDWLGFIFYPKSARYVGAALPPAVLKNIPAATRKVGVFVNAPAPEMLRAVKEYNLAAVQLHGDELPELCREMQQAGLLVFKAFSIDDNFDFNQLQAYEGTCDYFLFDTKGQSYGGNGIRFNWELLRHYTGTTPFLLSGGIDLDHVTAIKALQLPLLSGIDINSKFEMSPALKDSAKIAAFFKAIRG